MLRTTMYRQWKGKKHQDTPFVKKEHPNSLLGKQRNRAGSNRAGSQRNGDFRRRRTTTTSLRGRLRKRGRIEMIEELLQIPSWSQSQRSKYFPWGRVEIDNPDKLEGRIAVGMNYIHWGCRAFSKFDESNTPKKLVRKAVHALLLSLRHMHKNGLVHGDLKEDNMMYNEEAVAIVMWWQRWWHHHFWYIETTNQNQTNHSQM